MSQPTIGVIGGSGLYEIEGLAAHRRFIGEGGVFDQIYRPEAGSH